MPIYTLGDVAARYDQQVWRIRRLYERGLLPPAERIGTYRIVRESDLPQVEQALRTAGYLPTGEVEDAPRG
jgi:DNA-binding transcriptional MerR regulator